MQAQSAIQQYNEELALAHREAIAWWDLLIATLIAGVILLLGQAIVA